MSTPDVPSTDGLELGPIDPKNASAVAREAVEDRHDGGTGGDRKDGRLWLRVLLLVVFVCGYALYLPLATFMLWGSGRIWGPIACLAGFIVLVGPAIVIAGVSRASVLPSWAAVGIVVIAAGASGWFLNWVVDTTAPPAYVLAAQLDEIGVPQGWELVDMRTTAGSNCFTICPEACRWYRPATAVDEAVVLGADWFKHAGYSMGRIDWEKEPWFEGRGRHEDATVKLDVHGVGPRSRILEPLVEICLEGG